MTAVLFYAALAMGFSGGPPGQPATLYHKADSLFGLNNNTPKTDSMALAEFTAVIAQSKHGDTLLPQALLRKGILLDGAGDNAGAKEYYSRALANHPKRDSMVFVTQV